MRAALVIAILFFIGVEAGGETMVPAVDTQHVTVDINPKTGDRWETETDSVDIIGDLQSSPKEAQAAWKKACLRWKADFRDDHRDSKILDLNCGKSSCSADVGETKCQSKATYKIKTKEE